MFDDRGTCLASYAHGILFPFAYPNAQPRDENEEAIVESYKKLYDRAVGFIDTQRFYTAVLTEPLGPVFGEAADGVPHRLIDTTNVHLLRLQRRALNALLHNNHKMMEFVRNSGMSSMLPDKLPDSEDAAATAGTDEDSSVLNRLKPTVDRPWESSSYDEDRVPLSDETVTCARQWQQASLEDKVAAYLEAAFASKKKDVVRGRAKRNRKRLARLRLGVDDEETARQKTIQAINRDRRKVAAKGPQSPQNDVVE